MNTQRDELARIKVQTKGHTPGPWVYHADLSRVEDVPEFDLYRFDIMAIGIAKVEESDADGHLIAAAPKLLAALEAVLGLHRPDAETGKCEECTYARFSTASVRYPCPTALAITEALA